MSEVVLDASAVLAVLNSEPGADMVRPIVSFALLNAVNLAEVYTKLTEYGEPAFHALSVFLSGLGEVTPFTMELAQLTGQLRPVTRHLGLSLGDRACLAHAVLRNADVYTTEKVWAELSLPCRIRLIR